LRELAAAHEHPLEVILLERGAHLGGPLETIRRDGFVIETGADSFLSEKPWAADLARRLGIDADLIPTRDVYRKTFVVRSGRLVEIPAGFSLLAPAHPTVANWIAGAVLIGSRSACEVNQFWQYPQCKSHPSIPKLIANVPGSAWKNGFFSMGSHCNAPK